MERFYDAADFRAYDLHLTREQRGELNKLAERSGKKIEDLIRFSFRVGLLLAITQENGDSIIIREEQQLNLFDHWSGKTTHNNPLELNNSKPGKVTGGTFQTRLPSILAGELQEIANKHHVTVEQVESEFIDKGILLASIKSDPNKHIVLIEDNRERELNLNFWLD